VPQVDIHCSEIHSEKTQGIPIDPSCAGPATAAHDRAAGMLRMVITAASAQDRRDVAAHVGDAFGENLFAMPFASGPGKLHSEVPMLATHIPSRQLRRRMNVVMTSWNKLIRSARDTYRPELHYMRGPGPKWHAKHRGHSKNTL
jgi:hypothetical protein